MYARNIKVITADNEYEVAVSKDNGDILFIKSGGHGGVVLTPREPRDILNALSSVLNFHAPDSWTIQVKIDGEGGFDFEQNYDVDEWAGLYNKLKDASFKMDGLDPSDCNQWCGIDSLWRESLLMAKGYFQSMFTLSKREKLRLRLKEDSECPVLNSKLTIDNCVLLKCNHMVSMAAWEQIVPVGSARNFPCPLCRDEALTRSDVIYHPKRQPLCDSRDF